MINNNRQQNGRRRGRGGQRQGGGGNQGNGSRIDNRARGNAVQLLEKYKNLAADSQRQGDRVSTEYYLQFADHYFRVVSEQRGRFEEQDRQRRDPQSGSDEDDDFDGDDMEGRNDGPIARDRGNIRENGRDNMRDGGRDRDGERDGNREQPREHQAERQSDRPAEGDRTARPPRRERPERPPAPIEGIVASEGEPVDGADRPRVVRARAPRRDAVAADTFDASVLPPAFAPANDGDGATAEAKPRRRRLRPAGEAGQAG